MKIQIICFRKGIGSMQMCLSVTTNFVLIKQVLGCTRRAKALFALTILVFLREPSLLSTSDKYMSHGDGTTGRTL
jgi:hypothetical protein